MTDGRSALSSLVMIKPWKTLSSQQTFKDRYLSVRTDRCQHENGHIVPVYHVIEQTEWISVLPLTTDGNVVLIREYRHGAGKVTIGLPSGVGDPGETDIEAIAARELREETGYACTRLVRVGSAYANWANQDNLVHYFIGFGAHSAGPQRLDPNEEIEVLELPYGDYLDYGDLPVQHALHAAALFYTEQFFRKHPELRP